MLDKLLQEKMFEAVKREGLDLNDPAVQQKMTSRRLQIEEMLTSIITQQTKHCGCGKRSVDVEEVRDESNN